MADMATQPGLGVLDRAVGVEVNAERALAVLREFGLTEPDPGLRNAVAVALMEKTYLHEHQAAFPNVTKGLLEAIFSLGGPFLKRLAAVDSYRRASFSGAGALSKEVAEVIFALESWAASREWLVENAALGGTFAYTKAPPKVYERLLRQIVGVLCLARKEEVASRLLERLLSDVRHLRMTTVADAKTTLQEAIAPSTAEYSYGREGPDHETVFHATVTDTRGRRGIGLARNKKQAAQNAALDFLRRHIPQALSTRAPEPVPSLPLVAIPEPHQHVATVRKLQELFGLPPSATPLLSQALIHSSWAYEHGFEMAKYHQQNNQVLAFVGREAAEYEDALAAAGRATADPPQEFAFRGLANDGYNSLFRRSGLVSGLLLGAGQASKVTMEMGATALQAIIGAVFIAKGFPDSLATCWPQAWAPMWQTIASPTPRPHDPTTLLQQAASAMRLQAEYEFRRSGPDHASRSQATLVLDSETLCIRTMVTGSPVAGKTQAKHEVSTTVLRTLDLLAQPTMGRELATRAQDAKLARFLLAHQAALLATSPVPLQRWAVARLFGLHLAGVPDQLIAWADGADQLLDSRNTIEGTGARLEEAFRAVLEPVNTLRTQLKRTLETLEHISAPEELNREHLGQLVQLCGVYRCVGSEDPDIELPELADDWNLLYRGRLVAPAMPAARLTGRERAILDAAVAAVLLPGATATVEVTSTKPLCLLIVTDTGPAPYASAIAEICGIWSAVTNSTVLSPVDHGIEVTISATQSPAKPGPITAAVLAALRPKPDPYQASVADILHDLKNQAVAVGHAVMQPTKTETARLEQQLDARRHLERAHAMILQLRAATSLLEPVSDENVSVELGTFLRNYGRAAFAWLPDNIALSTPGASHSAYAAIDARVLTAILDNLVKNAAESMPAGGSIKLGWAADKYEAIIEVADDGPGLPAGIAQAFATGQRIHSTKPGGNGLGLLSAKSLLRRVGGQLTAAPIASGTAWEITLPIVARTLEDS